MPSVSPSSQSAPAKNAKIKINLTFNGWRAQLSLSQSSLSRTALSLAELSLSHSSLSRRALSLAELSLSQSSLSRTALSLSLVHLVQPRVALGVGRSCGGAAWCVGGVLVTRKEAVHVFEGVGVRRVEAEGGLVRMSATTTHTFHCSVSFTCRCCRCCMSCSFNSKTTATLRNCNACVCSCNMCLCICPHVV